MGVEVAEEFRMIQDLVAKFVDNELIPLGALREEELMRNGHQAG